MTFFSFILTLISVFLHAGWNFISKASKCTKAFYLVSNVIAAIMLLPAFIICPLPFNKLELSFFLFFAGSVFFEVLYSLGLVGAYKKGDISSVYPMVRALPVIMVAIIVTTFKLGSTPNLFAMIGFIFVTFGCFIIPQQKLTSINVKCFANEAIWPILLAAIGTTGYTVCDSLALKVLSKHLSTTSIATVSSYYFLIECGISLGLALFMFDAKEIADLKNNCIKSIYPYLTGIFSCLAYLLILFAMSYATNVAYIQAFRQMSLPIGVAMGVILLKEKLSLPRLTGIIIVFIGLLLTVIKNDISSTIIKTIKDLIQLLF